MENQMETQEVPTLLQPAVAYIHGACLVFLDALGSGSNQYRNVFIYGPVFTQQAFFKPVRLYNLGLSGYAKANIKYQKIAVFLTCFEDCTYHW